MNKSDFVIIGGVAAGPKTAATLARRLPDAKITLFQKEDRLSYATCGMPFFASGEVSDFEELTRTAFGVVRNAEYFNLSKGFEAVTGAEVTAIDRGAKTVTVRDLNTGEEHQHGYGKLVLAMGGIPSTPPFPVADSEQIGTFTRPSDAMQFRKLAQTGQVGEAVIIGSGLIGCELTEAVVDMWGIQATVIEKENQVLPYALDPEMAAMVTREMEKQEITVLTGAAVEKVEVDGDGRPVVFVSGRDPIVTDYVFLAMGVRPNVELARAAGLEIGKTGGVVVDAMMKTSDPDIYAGGDCVETVNQLTGAAMYLPMGSLANRQGRIIAENLAGNPVKFRGALGAFVLRVFGLNIGVVGLSNRSSQKAGLDTTSVWGSFVDKPDYFPEAKNITLKMTFETGTRRLLGLQAVGGGDICRRIDVFSSFLQRKAVVEDLYDFEHCYAPPFAEALDPLHHMAAMVDAAERGMAYRTPEKNFDSDQPAIWIDVREENEVEAQPLPIDKAGEGAKLLTIPLNNLKSQLDGIDRDSLIIIACQRGSRSYQAALLLKANGFTRVESLGGGLHALL